MLKKLFILIFSFCFLCDMCAYAQDVSATCAISMDADTGVVLLEKNAHTKRAVASTTKIMTCLLACESDRLDETVVITPQMLDGAYGSMIYLNVGDKISLLDLVKGSMLASGNDAANAIACYLADDAQSFSSLMNERANQIGMTNTSFVTPSGLDSDNHYSTAYDMALLAKTALDNKIFASICCLQSCTILINDKEQTIYNHNKLLSDKDCVGVKTGFTDNAGRCLVSAYEYKDNIIINVTLNAPNDWQDHKAILKAVKSKYKAYQDSIKTNISVVGGDKETINCCAGYNVVSPSGVSIKAFYYPFCYAPIRKGDAVGYLQIISNDKIIRTVEITALGDVKLWQITK